MKYNDQSTKVQHPDNCVLYRIFNCLCILSIIIKKKNIVKQKSKSYFIKLSS